MRKKKYLRSAASFVLAVTLFLGQTAAAGADDIFTDQPGAWDSAVSFDDGEEPAGEAADGSGAGTLFTDGSDSSEEQRTEEKMDTAGASAEKAEEAFASEETGAEQAVTARPEVTASVSVSEEGTNIWHVNADWTITNAGEDPVTLALSMDDLTRQALPAEWQAGEDGVCHFLLTDGTALPLTLRTEESAPGKVYLATEQAGNGEYHLDFLLHGTGINADQHSALDLVVYDEETQIWSQAAHAELDWRVIQEEEPQPSEMPEEAEPTEIPQETDAEEVLEPIEVVEDAEPAEAPEEIEPTKIPEEAESTEISEEKTEDETIAGETEPGIDETEAEESGKYAAGASADAEGAAVRTLRASLRSARSMVQDSIDMSDYITDAKFTPSEIEEGELLQLSISYKIQSSELINAGTDKLTYQLPEGIAPFETASGTVYNKNREAVGTYEITKTGAITIAFNDSFVQSGNSITGDIHFWTLLSAEGDGEEHEYTFSESNQIIAKIKIKESENPGGETGEDKTDLYVKKQDTAFDKENQIASYEIMIGTNNGTKNDISFNDDFTEAEDTSGHKVTGEISGTGTISKIAADGNKTSLEFSEYFETANGDIKLKEEKKLPALKAGEQYVIKYNVRFWGIDQMNGDVKLTNTVNVSDERSYPSDSVEISFNHTYIKKSSTYDTKADKINWQIMLNDFGADLTGYELTDTLKKNGEKIALPENVTLTEYLDNGSTVDREISIPYKFEAENVTSTKHKFVVSYSTDVSKDGFYTKYGNTASIGGYTSESGQDIKHDSGVLSKSYEKPEKDAEITEERVDENTRHYLWNVVITPPSDGIKEGSYYSDSMSAQNHLNQNVRNAHYITAKQFSAMEVKYQNVMKGDVASDAYEKQVNVDGKWVTFTSQVGPFTEFRILFKKKVEEAIVLSYRTTADLSDMAEGAVWTFTNSGSFVQDNGSTHDSDSTKEAKGGYLKKVGMFLGSDGTVQLGGDGSTKVYDECKGILYYNITVNETQGLKYGDGEIVVEDILPEGTTLYRGAYPINAYSTSGAVNDKVVKFYWNNNQNSNMFDKAGGTVDRNYESDMKIDEIASWTYDEQTRKLTIRIPESVYGYIDAVASHIIRVFYAVQITDALGKDETKEYKNNATMYLNGEEKATDFVTDKVISSYITKMHCITDNEDEASYRILINPTGARLAGGSNLTLLDALDYTKHTVTYRNSSGADITKQYINSVSLKPNSFHLYKLNADGSTGSEISTALYTVHYGEDPDGTSYKMEIQIPDETPCVLEYTYKFSVDAAALKSAGKDSYDVINDINLSGSVTDGSGDKSEIKFQGSGASADTSSLLLTKVDEDNQIVYLKGAVFQLQKYVGKTDDWSADDNWQNVKIYVTGENGTASLAGLDENTAYRLQEIEPPTNYISNKTKQYFYVGSNTDNFPDEFVKEAAKNKTETGSIIVTNKKSDTENISVSVKKRWEDAKGNALPLEDIVDKDGKRIECISISLYQKTEANAQIAENDTPLKTVELSHDDDNNWYYSFNNLPKVDKNGNPYYYYVRENGYAKTDTGTEINLEESYKSSLDVTEGIRGGTVNLTNKKLPGKTQVTVKKDWAEGSTPVEIPVILYKSKTKPQGVSDKQVSVTVKFTGNNSSEYSKTEQFTVMKTGTNITFVINSEKNIFPDILSYQMGGVTYTVEGKKKKEQRDWQTRYVWTYVLKNVTDDVLVQMSVSEYANEYLAEISLDRDSCFVSNKLILPEDAERVDPIIKLYSSGDSTTSTGNDTYTWSDLSDEYYYYVQEGTETTPGYMDGYVANYEYTYWDAPDNTQIKEVTITNTSTSAPTETSITAQKKWQIQSGDDNWTEVSDTSADNQQLPESITFKLYRSTTQNDANLTDTNLVPGEGTKTVMASDNWTYTWTGLPKTTGDDGTGDTYYYYVKEADGSLGAYSPEIDHQEGVTAGTINLTNKITSVTVKKKWLSADGTDISESDCSEKSVAVQLYRTDAPGYNYAIQVGAQQTLNSENSWSYTWQGLPEGTYYVQEVSELKGFTTSYQTEDQVTAQESKSNASEATVSGGEILITNKKESTNLQVTKKWSDGTDNKPGIEVKLYRTTTAPEGSTPPDQSSNMSVTVKVDWEESNGDKSTTLPGSGSCNVTFINQVTNESKSITLGPSTWESSITLPATSSDGTVQQYSVSYDPTIQIDSATSAAVTGNVQTISGIVENQTVTLTAKKNVAMSSGNNGKFTVKVTEWKKNGWESTEAPNLADEAYIDVYIHSSNGWTKIHDDPLCLKAPNWSAEYEYSNVDNGVTYYVDTGTTYSNSGLWVCGKQDITGAGQINISLGYSSALEAADITSVASAPLVSATSNLTTTSNTESISEKPTLCSAMKENLVLDMDGQEVTITDAEYMSAEMDKTLDASNGWTDSWSNLDKTDEDGNLYYYYAVETPVSGYDASYQITYVDDDSSKGISSVEITNTKNETDKTSITIQKNWNGDIVEGASYAATFTLYDKITDLPVNIDGVQTEKTITGNGSCTWSDLPLGTYYAVEKNPKCNNEIISNCTTTYQADSGTVVSEGAQASTTGGTITVINTVTKQGITLPGTGSKYPLVFYGLGLTFLLISTVWMLLTFKKRNTPIDAGKGGKRSKN